MLIQDDLLLALIRTYLPQSDNDTLNRIATEVKGDVEAIVHSMIRRAVAQEKQNLYLKHKSTG
ncbi:MAG: hypothetical protein H6Q73_3264 [Firmicutes bacterium]|nr:hypothetical protein [Bacillota bacterium]